MAVFAGARTQDLMGLSIRLAGFEIRDTLGWIYGSGMPKSHNISKAIDKKLGKEREVIGKVDMRGAYDGIGRESAGNTGASHVARGGATTEVTAPASDEAQQWDGWGTALKPAIEPIILARKPLDGTVANNVLAHGVGGLNIDACRVGMSDADREAAKVPMGDWSRSGTTGATDSRNGATFEPAPAGRFPANVLLDEHAAKEMDKQSGVSVSRANTSSDNRGAEGSHIFASASLGRRDPSNSHNDSGGASRFFPVFKYQAKAPKKERPVIEREDGTKIQHPTVKPLTLLEWLVTLITPPGGVVLDPFAGSGTTLQAAINKGFQPIGIEQDADYIKLIEKRLEATCTTHKN